MVNAQYNKVLDTVMMREIVGKKINCAKGMSTTEEWQQVTDAVNKHLESENKTVTLRQTRDRAKFLLKQHRQAERNSEKA